MTGVIPGPKDTAYEGGKFRFLLVFEIENSQIFIKFRFLTKIWHCNVSTEGEIAQEVMDEFYDLTVSTVLSTVIEILEEPKSEFPRNYEAMALHQRNIDEYNYIARNWTLKYAN